MHLSIEAATLLYQMQQNRPNGLRKEAAIAALKDKETDPLIEPIRKELHEKLCQMNDNEYLIACLEAIKNHISAGEDPATTT